MGDGVNATTPTAIAGVKDTVRVVATLPSTHRSAMANMRETK